jgi:hypothetical protein
VVFNGVGHGLAQAVVQRVVAAHDALQLGELAHHVGHEVGLGQQCGLVGLFGHQLRRPAQLRGNGLGDGAHALGALALRAQLVVVDHLAQAAAREARVFLRSWSKKNLASARRGRTTRSLPSMTALASLGLMLLTTRNWLVSLPCGIQQRKVLLVGLHGEDQALLRHVQKLFFKLADQHVGALDQGGHFVQQCFIFDSWHRLPAFALQPF